MSLIPNVPPKIFTLSAVALGYLLIDDNTANEQNALGNWLMLTAQVLCTNAAYKQFQQGFNSTQSGNVTGGGNNPQQSNEDTIKMLTKMVNALNKEINDIKKSL